MGPLQSPLLSAGCQSFPVAAPQPFGCCRCLLKGCERWFRPVRPQALYCSDACRAQARRWRRRQAARRYRASQKGKQRRRLQSQRYRQRQAAAAANPSEGQRLPANPLDFEDCPCQRPGCDELFVPAPRCPGQRFCSQPCRQALRRVRQRQVRRLERRRRGARLHPGCQRAPPACRE